MATKPKETPAEFAARLREAGQLWADPSDPDAISNLVEFVVRERDSEWEKD